MPIYAYRCSNCGHAQDALQKISDPVLTVCPACGQPTYVKQVTAAGFQLKGSGWYVTDFRGDKKAGKAAETGEAGQGDAKAPAAANGTEKGGDKSGSDRAGDAPPASPSGRGESTGSEAGKKSETAAPTSAAAPAAAPAPSTSATPGKTGS
ncbi:MAG: FmdB family zinc ribbon protein [Caldimonas sp.]